MTKMQNKWKWNPLFCCCFSLLFLVAVCVIAKKHDPKPISTLLLSFALFPAKETSNLNLQPIFSFHCIFGPIYTCFTLVVTINCDFCLNIGWFEWYMPIPFIDYPLINVQGLFGLILERNNPFELFAFINCKE